MLRASAASTVRSGMRSAASTTSLRGLLWRVGLLGRRLGDRVRHRHVGDAGHQRGGQPERSHGGRPARHRRHPRSAAAAGRRAAGRAHRRRPGRPAAANRRRSPSSCRPPGTGPIRSSRSSSRPSSTERSRPSSPVSSACRTRTRSRPRVVAQVIRDDVDRPESDVPGVVIIQIDGLAAPLLRAQVRAGNLPTLSRWIRGGSHRMIEWTALPAVADVRQPGGPAAREQRRHPGLPLVREGGPAAAGLQPPGGRREIERRLSTATGSWPTAAPASTTCSAAMRRSRRLTMSTVDVNKDQAGATRSLVLLPAQPVQPRAGDRPHARRGGEGGLPGAPAARRGIEPRMHRGGTYPFLRAATNVVLRDLNLALVTEQMLRGDAGRSTSTSSTTTRSRTTPGRSGPRRSTRSRGSTGRSAGSRARRRAARDRTGSSSSRTTARARARRSASATARRSRSGSASGWPPRTHVDGHRASGRAAGSAVGGPHRGQRRRRRRAEHGAPRDARPDANGIVELGPIGEERSAAAPTRLPDLVVCASGNLALVYFGLGDGRLTSGGDRWRPIPGLVDDLVAHDGVGLVLVKTETDGSVVLGQGGRYRVATAR